MAGALKGAIFAANIYERFGFLVVPDAKQSRHDIIQAITFGTPEAVIAFCQGIQAAAPVDSFVTPEPWDFPFFYFYPLLFYFPFFPSGFLYLSLSSIPAIASPEPILLILSAL